MKPVLRREFRVRFGKGACPDSVCRISRIFRPWLVSQSEGPRRDGGVRDGTYAFTVFDFPDTPSPG
jgi:hypothetical protein